MRDQVRSLLFQTTHTLRINSAFFTTAMSSLAGLVARAVSLLWLAGAFSLTLFTYERALVPQYAYVPTTDHLLKVLLSALFVGAYVPIGWSSSTVLLLSASILAAAPNATYWSAVHTARLKDPIWGPVVIHILVLVPLVVAFVLPARIALSSVSYSNQNIVLSSYLSLEKVCMEIPRSTGRHGSRLRAV